MNAAKIEMWKGRFQACYESGLSYAAWCNQAGVSLNTFYHVRSKFVRKLGIPLPERVTRPRKEETPVNPGVTFVEMPQIVSLQAEDEAKKDSSTLDAADAKLMLKVGNYQLYIGDGFCDRTLSSVLEVLSHA